MKIKVLGTAAAEGVPAMFCNCENCTLARELKGKNFRARTQNLIDGDLLVDFNEDTYLNGQRFGIDLSAVKHILITHAHEDHLSCYGFDCINAAVNRTVEKVNLLGGEYILEELIRVREKSTKGLLESGKLNFIPLEKFKTTVVGEYSITPMQANHAGGKAFIYIIEKAGKSMLYCLDTGKLPEEDFEFMKTLKKPFDFVLIDCTYGRVPADKYGGHLSLYDGANQIKLMKETGAVTDKTRVMVTHFAHWHIPSHQAMEEMASEFNFEVAYDGAEIEF